LLACYWMNDCVCAVGEQGRMKYVRPLYRVLANSKCVRALFLSLCLFVSVDSLFLTRRAHAHTLIGAERVLRCARLRSIA